MSAQPRMVAIGTATLDVFIVGGDDFKPEKHDGKSVEHIPLGEKLEMDDVVFTTGGNAMNASITFARQGLDSKFVGFIGTDPAGMIVMNALDDEEVDTTDVHQREGFKTSYSTVLLAPTGERTILRYYGSVKKLHADDYDLSCIDNADWLYLSSVGSMELLNRIINHAAKKGVKVAINPGTRELENPSKLRTLLDDVEILITNKEEMQKIVDGITREELLRNAARLVPTVVISDGPNGVVATDSKTMVQAGMYDDVPVIDRTGAGDAFGSGFVAAIARGKSLDEAVVLASANATSVVGHIGATPGILKKGAHLHEMPLKVKDF